MPKRSFIGNISNPLSSNTTGFKEQSQTSEIRSNHVEKKRLKKKETVLPPKSTFWKAQKKYENKKREIEMIRKQREQREQQVKKKKRERLHKKKQLFRRTSKGQPILSGRVLHLLNKIQSSC